jgi:CRISPR-associated endonuclease/helicase Cas3
MGGEDPSDWDTNPEQDAILIGTQDMLLSRAMNRGFGMSRYRWPVHFGLLNNDCLWVLDETQLMGVGLTTSAQLQGFRDKLSTFGPTHTLWMSATLEPKGINTVDHPEESKGFVSLGLNHEDESHEGVSQKIHAKKSLETATVTLSAESDKKHYAKELALEVQHAHRPGSLTLVILNRVSRAQRVFTELGKLTKSKNDPLQAQLAIIHARFRSSDRLRNEDLLFASELPDAGRIVIATQAIEAGVDISAETLFTELAPWPSLVQRFGRCNRYGESENSRVIVIQLEPKDEKDDRVLLPYQLHQIDQSKSHLKELTDVGPTSIESVRTETTSTVRHTIRRKDLLDLWDTTPDLAGNDLDISRFIREADDSDLQFFWRDLGDETPAEGLLPPQREELCAVAVGQAKDFLKSVGKSKDGKAWVWNGLTQEWVRASSNDVRPGNIVLLDSKTGGYDDNLGWTGDPSDTPTPIQVPVSDDKMLGMSDDDLGSEAIDLSQHLQDVLLASRSLETALAGSQQGIPWLAVHTAALWHDVGKAHSAFQTAMRDAPALANAPNDKLWAKSGAKTRPRYRMPDQTKRIGFRHELASALAWLAHNSTDPFYNLTAFLIAAHHGKVRGSLRSLPNEKASADHSIRFARGIWEGDKLPSVRLDDKTTIPETTLSLVWMELGEGDHGPSWLARILDLRDEFGPFRLSYLETLVRIADWRASSNGGNSHE